MKTMTKTMTKTMVARFSSMLVAPMLLALAVGCVEPVDRSTEDVRGVEIEDEPCEVDDCIPISPLLGACPDGFEPDSWSECVDADGECVWEFHDDCVPIAEPEPEPEPAPDPEVVPHVPNHPTDICRG